MSDRLVTLNCSRDVRFEGSLVSGTVNLNLAKAKDVSAVKVSLKGWIFTWVRVNTGQNSHRARDDEPLFKVEQTVWTPEAFIPDPTYTTISLPFNLTIPNGAFPLPASFRGGSSSCSALIQYYVHVVVEKPAWYKRNTRINAPFPLLPLDRTSAPTLRFDNWSGPWKEWRKSIDVRSNVLKLFGGQGTVEAAIFLPQVGSLPLFTRIPCRVEIICSSKPMPSSSSTDSSSFTFPRNPKKTSIKLELVQRVLVKPRSHHRWFVEGFGYLGGFGKVGEPSNIQSEMTGPIWIPDEEKPDKKGCWKESVTYTSHLFLRCATPIHTRLIETEICIEGKIEFPGLGNTWNAVLRSLPISSGVASPPETNGVQGANVYDIAVPPSYWEVMGEDGGESTDEKR